MHHRVRSYVRRSEGQPPGRYRRRKTAADSISGSLAPSPETQMTVDFTLSPQQTAIRRDALSFAASVLNRVKQTIDKCGSQEARFYAQAWKRAHHHTVV